MEEIGSLLLSLKDKALDAAQRGDEDFYRKHLAENSINIIQSGIFNKEGFIKKLTAGNSPNLKILTDDTQVFLLNNGSGVITYKAASETSGENLSASFLITTIYSNINGRWQIIFYQQTPIL
jgi:hypothetical protein